MVTHRKMWIGGVVGVTLLHFVVNRALGVGSTPALWWTDLGNTIASALAAVACVRTARRHRDRHNRIAWLALAGGAAMWFIAAVIWSIRELLLGVVAPEPSWADVPFYFLAPGFALALVVYRRRPASRAFQLTQIADLGLLCATIAIAGTLLFAPSLRSSGFTPYAVVAIGYPGFYLAVVIVALLSLGRGTWGPRRIVLGVLIWANLAFAVVDVLYGANALVERYQTGIEDTLWIFGFAATWWAAAEERNLFDAAPIPEVDRGNATWNALVGAVALIAIAALAFEGLIRLSGVETTIVGVAVVVAAAFVGLRMWAGQRTEDAYLDAVAVGEEKERELSEERGKVRRLRAVSSLAGGTAHELNNLLQAIVGSLELLRRRAARGEDVATYVTSIEHAIERLSDQVKELRNLSPAETAQGMILILPGGDRDGKLAAILDGAGFAPAVVPDLEAAQRAAKGPGVRALVASPEEAAALEQAGFTLPIIRCDRDNIVDAVVAVVDLVSDA